MLSGWFTPVCDHRPPSPGMVPTPTSPIAWNWDQTNICSENRKATQRFVSCFGFLPHVPFIPTNMAPVLTQHDYKHTSHLVAWSKQSSGVCSSGCTGKIQKGLTGFLVGPSGLKSKETMLLHISSMVVAVVVLCSGFWQLLFILSFQWVIPDSPLSYISCWNNLLGRNWKKTRSMNQIIWSVLWSKLNMLMCAEIQV